MTIQMIIKGTVSEATEAAQARGITFKQVRRASDQFNETVARCSHRYRGKVVQWFCAAPYEAPYPVGSLLWYAESE